MGIGEKPGTRRIWIVQVRRRPGAKNRLSIPNKGLAAKEKSGHQSFSREQNGLSPAISPCFCSFHHSGWTIWSLYQGFSTKSILGNRIELDSADKGWPRLLGQVGGGNKVESLHGYAASLMSRSGVAGPGFLPICLIRGPVVQTGMRSLACCRNRSNA